jgi:ABC-type transporter Mla MlaB component
VAARSSESRRDLSWSSLLAGVVPARGSQRDGGRLERPAPPSDEPIEVHAIVCHVKCLPALDHRRSAGDPKEIAWGAPPHVVVDVAGLTSVDSSGVDALVQAARALEALGRTAVLAAPSPEARRAFEIVQVAQVVSVVEDRESALSQYAPDDHPEALADDGW